MRILALDVAVSGCNVACFDSQTGQTTLKNWPTDRGQAEMLVPMIGECVTEAGWAMDDIDRIAVTRGPGSFTGVRIGLATARTLGLALAVPVLGFSTLAVMLEQAQGLGQQPKPDNILAIIDTKRDDYYAISSSGADAVIMTPDQVEEWKQATGGRVIDGILPDLVVMARAAAAVSEAQIASFAPTPIYVRDAETSTPKSA